MATSYYFSLATLLLFGKYLFPISARISSILHYIIMTILYCYLIFLHPEMEFISWGLCYRLILKKAHIAWESLEVA